MGGYPIQSWWGTPSSHGGEGYPIQSWWGGVPHPDLARGYPRYPPTIQTWLGVTQVPPTIQTWPGYPPPSRSGQGTPHHPDMAGIPPPTIKTWPGYPLPSRPGWGTLSPSRPGWGTLPPHPDLTGYPPPPRSRGGLTKKLKTVPSPILRMRAVITLTTKAVHFDTTGHLREVYYELQ